MPTIIVSGQAGSGKTTIAKIIQEALHRAGFAVVIPETEQEEMDALEGDRFQRSVRTLRDRGPVRLNAVQIQREDDLPGGAELRHFTDTRIVLRASREVVTKPRSKPPKRKRLAILRQPSLKT